MVACGLLFRWRKLTVLSVFRLVRLLAANACETVSQVLMLATRCDEYDPEKNPTIINALTGPSNTIDVLMKHLAWSSTMSE